MGARGPKIFEATGDDAAAQSDDGVGPAHRPAQSGLLEPLTDHGATARLGDP